MLVRANYGAYGDPPLLSSGWMGDAVTTLQIDLSTMTPAYLTSDQVDGNFGSQTQEAVQSFQTAQGLPATGQVDVATWNAIAAALPASSNAIPSYISVTDIPGSISNVSSSVSTSLKKISSGTASATDWILIAVLSAVGLGGAYAIYRVIRNRKAPPAPPSNQRKRLIAGPRVARRTVRRETKSQVREPAKKAKAAAPTSSVSDEDRAAFISAMKGMGIGKSEALARLKSTSGNLNQRISQALKVKSS